MQLFYAPLSPYARKCRVIILEKGLSDKVELVEVVTADNDPRLLAVNPLGTIPALATDAGLHLCESPIICEYLDSLPSSAPALIPQGDARLCALSLAALADGIADAAVHCVLDSRRPADKQFAPWVERKTGAILRALAKVDAAKLKSDVVLDIGNIALICAWDYTVFRLPQLNLREKFPELAVWINAVNARPSFMATWPV